MYFLVIYKLQEIRISTLAGLQYNDSLYKEPLSKNRIPARGAGVNLWYPLSTRPWGP
jgi:hypothetical protein